MKSWKIAKGADKVQDLASTFEIVNGVIQLPSLRLQLSQAETVLGGGIGLDKSLKLEGTLRLTQEFVEALIIDRRLKKALLGLEKELIIPLKIEGTMEKPVILPDNNYLKQRFQAYLKEDVEQDARQLIDDAVKTKKLPTKSKVRRILKGIN